MYIFIKNSVDPHYTMLYENLCNEEFITLDTEFERRNTYFAIPALLQIAGSKQTYIIDMIAIQDYTPIKKLVENPSILKVLHCGFQDLEILQNLGIETRHCFDTQIAMQFLGFDANIGFESLITEIVKCSLDKAQQKSNWMLRPLQEAQLQYAAQDVILLRDAYVKLKEKLQQLPNLYEWCLEDSNNAIPNLEKRNYTILKLFCKLEPQLRKLEHKLKAFHILKYREQRAVIKNKSRKHVIKDENIVGMILQSKIPRAIKDYIESALDSKAMEAVEYAKSRRTTLNLEEQKIVEALSAQILVKSKKYNVPAKLIASQKDIVHYIKNNSSKLNLGWRNSILQEIRNKSVQSKEK